MKSSDIRGKLPKNKRKSIEINLTDEEIEKMHKTFSEEIGKAKSKELC